MTDQLILIGAGGHCLSCIEVIEANGKFVIKGILDAKTPSGTAILNYKVLGNDELIGQLASDFFLITVGQIKTPAARMKLAQQIKKAGGRLATIADPGARISNSSRVGEGSIVMQQVIVNANCSIGEQAILNNKCLVEHDCTIGDFCHISTGALVNGGCTIGDRVFVGSGAVCINNISIAHDVVIGAGAVVNASIEEPGIYAGNPARKISGIHA